MPDNNDTLHFRSDLDAKSAIATIKEMTVGIKTPARDLYAASLALRKVTEPRAGTPITKGGPRFMGSVALGPVQERGRFYVRLVLVIEREGVQWIKPRFRSRIEAESFERRLAMRVGPRLGLLRDMDAQHGLEAHLWALPMPRKPSVTPDAIRAVLEDYVAGHPLDETRLYDTARPFEDVVGCGEGSTWRRILTFEGAAEVTNDCISYTARDYEYLAEVSEDGVPQSDFYFLRTGDEDARFTAVTVRVPKSVRDGAVEVVGKIGRNPFPCFADQVAVLAAHVGRHIGPEHYTLQGEAMGEDDIAMARFGL